MPNPVAGKVGKVNTAKIREFADRQSDHDTRFVLFESADELDRLTATAQRRLELLRDAQFGATWIDCRHGDCPACRQNYCHTSTCPLAKELEGNL